MADIQELKRGTQIIYVPSHAGGGRLDHPNCEEGFVTSTKWLGSTEIAYCRFWSQHDPERLRTRINSEACNAKWLVVKDTRPQHVVDRILATIS